MINDVLQCDVLIVGAGPTGLTLANILGRGGVQVLVVEKHESTVRAPRAVSIDDESLRTMQSIGLVEEVLRNAAADYGSHYYGADGRCFAKVEPTTREYGYPRRSAFTQPELEKTLLCGAGRYRNVRVLFQHEVNSIEEGSRDVVVRAKSCEDTVVVIRAAYVVGCDGARSICRKHIGSVFTGSSYPQRWLIVDLANTCEFLRQTRVLCDPRRPLITLPGPNGIRRYEFMLHGNEDETVVVREDFVRSLLASNGPDQSCSIVRAEVYTFHALIADKWSRDRIYLAGDAVHLSPPFAGQGLNSGLRDAHNLGWKLAAVVRGEFSEALLATYFQEREPHARALIQLAVQMGKIMMPRSQGTAFLYQTLLRSTQLIPQLNSYIAQMKYKPKPFYQKGFLAAETARNQWAGRMLPQPLVETKDKHILKLDECLEDRCQLVVVGPNAQRWIQDCSRYDFGFDDCRPLAVLPNILNPDPDLPARSRVVRAIDKTINAFVKEDQTVAMLLRPDRYIAAATSDGLLDLATQSRLLFEAFGGSPRNALSSEYMCHKEVEAET